MAPFYTNSKASIRVLFPSFQLKIHGQVLSYPPTTSSFQYQSSAVRINTTAEVFHRGININTFFSFMIVFPILTTLIFVLVLSSQYQKIKERIKEKGKEHKTFVAIMGIGLIFSSVAIATDISAAILHQHNLEMEFYSCSLSERNTLVLPLLIVSIIVEASLVICLDILPLVIIPIMHTRINCCKSRKHCKDFKVDVKWYVVVFILSLIPPQWCFFSRFGFIIVALTSFVRHSASFTILYILGTFVMFFIMRQAYSLIESLSNFSVTRDQENDKMKHTGELILIIWVVRCVGVFVVGIFFYLSFGLWLLPVSEVVEDAPVYLSNVLMLSLIVLAAVISYELYDMKKSKKNTTQTDSSVRS